MKNISQKQSISVIGLGVVGLTTAVGFALKGHKVLGIDIDSEKVKQINNGICPMYEKGLGEALKKVRILATTDYSQVLNSDISFLCGGTPPKADGSINFYYLEVPAKQLAETLQKKKEYHIVVVRSTVVPGTTEKIIFPLFKDIKDRVGICVNPEFLREGTALEDFLAPSRIVIGTYEKRVYKILENIYKDFNSPILKTDIRTAEMIKEASNAFLATRISFINEIGNICKELDIDVYKVAEGMGYDDRIGGDYLRAGVGFGGFCLPKDLSALISMANELGHKPILLKAVQQINYQQPKRMVKILKRYFPSLENKTIGVLGLAFKPGTDDIRKSKSLEIIDALVAEGARIRAYDPQAMKNFQKVFSNHVVYAEPDEILRSDAILIMTEWDEFDKLDYKGKIVIDGRRIPKAREAKIYEGICW